MRDCIRFFRNGQLERIGPIDPTLTVLEWLRTHDHCTGTKEGCAEGDCGACTVLVGELKDDKIAWRVVNACIMFMPMLDGKALLTVEGISQEDQLHPVQRSMVKMHGSQCGFCTPGIVMSLCSRSMGAMGSAGISAEDLLAGNLCRCTGYGPILSAVHEIDGQEAQPYALESLTIEGLRSLQHNEPLSIESVDRVAGSAKKWFAPRTLEQLATLLETHPRAQMIAGGTDVGLWVTKQHRVMPEMIYVGDIVELARIIEDEKGITFGAGVRYTDAITALKSLHADLGELVRRIGAVQVRNMGTIGGNIANGSPIGDMPPALIALGATITLRQGNERRTIPLEDYFIDYGKQDRRLGEFLESIFVPRPASSDIVRIVKHSKRFDSDISAVCCGIALSIDCNVIVKARVAFGGMAGTPQRAKHCESTLIGSTWSAASLDKAAQALCKDFQPLTDVRGSAEYRLTVAGNILRRLWWEQELASQASSSVQSVLPIGLVPTEGSHG